MKEMREVKGSVHFTVWSRGTGNQSLCRGVVVTISRPSLVVYAPLHFTAA